MSTAVRATGPTPSSRDGRRRPSCVEGRSRSSLGGSAIKCRLADAPAIHSTILETGSSLNEDNHRRQGAKGSERHTLKEPKTAATEDDE